MSSAEKTHSDLLGGIPADFRREGSWFLPEVHPLSQTDNENAVFLWSAQNYKQSSVGSNRYYVEGPDESSHSPDLSMSKAIVVRAWDIEKQKIVRLKIIDLSVFVSEKEKIRRLRGLNREAILTARMAGAPGIENFFRYKDLVVMAMEDLDKKEYTSVHRMLQGDIPLTQALSILEQVGKIMDQDVRIYKDMQPNVEVASPFVNRDLKPEHILVSNDANTVKIIDYGLAKRTFFVLPDRAAGTFYYTSPEQARSEPTIDERSDIYSLGVIALEMITKRNYHGRRQNTKTRDEFQGIPTKLKVDDPTDVLFRTQDKRNIELIQPFLEATFPGVDMTRAVTVFKKALSFRAKDRYKRASEFVEDLKKSFESKLTRG